jgi:hypothetical protein
LVVPSTFVPFESRHNRIQYVLIAKRFGKEVHGAAFHRLDGHWDISMPRHENDRDVDICSREFGLQIEPAQAG